MQNCLTLTILPANQLLETAWLLALVLPITYLSSQVHHDKKKRFEECLLVLENPSERQPLHEKLNGHHTPQLCIPGLFITTRTQAFHNVRKQRQLARLERKTNTQP